MYDVNVIADGLALVLQLDNLAWLVVGFAMGLVVGVIPGFSEGTYLALILPFTLYMEPWSALIFMTACYMGAECAGEYPSILLNMPGTVGTVASAFEGFPLTRQGFGGQALGASIAASAFGGTFGALTFMFVGPLIGVYAARFQSPEMFMIAVFGLTAIASVTGGNALKGLASALLGLLLATTGSDMIVGSPRATFGFLELSEGLPLLPVMLGLFGFAEILRMAGRSAVVGKLGEFPRFSAPLEGMREAMRHPIALIRSTLIGLIIGVIPGTGAATATVVSYGQARMWSRHPERFGKGSYEGLVSTDSANNACVPGTLVPTLALGIPGSGTAAIMLAALLLHGLRPGPGFWSKYAVEAYALGFTCLIASLLSLVACFLMVRTICRAVFTPSRILIPVISLLCIVGAFSYRNSLFDVGLMVAFGLLGVLLQAYRWSVPAVLLGIILGPIAEENFFRSLSVGGPLIFFTKPLSLLLFLCALVSIGLPPLMAWRRRSRTVAA